MRRLGNACIAAIVFGALAGTAGPAHAQWTGACLPKEGGPTCHFWVGKAKFIDDGDTIDVRLTTSTGRRKVVRVRMTGIQAMEQYSYSSHPSRRRGECHAVEATARIEQLTRRVHGLVRLSAQRPGSATGSRLRRWLAVKLHGSWHDVGRRLLKEGYVLWLPNRIEYAWNATYGALAQYAAARGVNLWDPDACGVGPSAESPLRLTVNYDADGNDFLNVNGEWVAIQNLDPVNAVPLAGWWVRDSALRRYRFPSWAAIPPSGTVRVHVGMGADTDTSFYWGLDNPAFENANANGRGMGDGAYLFDPQGDLRAWQMYPCRGGACTGP